MNECGEPDRSLPSHHVEKQSGMLSARHCQTSTQWIQQPISAQAGHFPPGALENLLRRPGLTAQIRFFLGCHSHYPAFIILKCERHSALKRITSCPTPRHTM